MRCDDESQNTRASQLPVIQIVENLHFYGLFSINSVLSVYQIVFLALIEYYLALVQS